MQSTTFCLLAQAFEDMLFSRALDAGYYVLQNARDEYRHACGLSGMHRDLVIQYVEVGSVPSRAPCLNIYRKWVELVALAPFQAGYSPLLWGTLLPDGLDFTYSGQMGPTDIYTYWTRRYPAVVIMKLRNTGLCIWQRRQVVHCMLPPYSCMLAAQCCNSDAKHGHGSRKCRNHTSCCTLMWVALAEHCRCPRCCCRPLHRTPASTYGALSWCAPALYCGPGGLYCPCQTVSAWCRTLTCQLPPHAGISA